MTAYKPVPTNVYKSLIEAFLGNRISVDEFEAQYNDTFLHDTGGYPKETFHILNGIFAEIDAYWPKCQPGQETKFQISEQELRRQAAITLEQLKQLS